MLSANSGYEGDKRSQTLTHSTCPYESKCLFRINPYNALCAINNLCHKSDQKSVCYSTI